MNLGFFGYAAGTDVDVIDDHGLADVAGSHLQLHERGRPGHEKALSDVWTFARYAAPGCRGPPAISAAEAAAARPRCRAAACANLDREHRGTVARRRRPHQPHGSTPFVRVPVRRGSDRRGAWSSARRDRRGEQLERRCPWRPARRPPGHRARRAGLRVTVSSVGGRPTSRSVPLGQPVRCGRVGGRSSPWWLPPRRAVRRPGVDRPRGGERLAGAGAARRGTRASTGTIPGRSTSTCSTG